MDSIGEVRAADGDSSLYIQISVANTSKTKKVDFSSWSESSSVSLRDNLDNTYSRVRLNARRLWEPYLGEQIKNRAIHPGEAIKDFVIFGRPVKAAKTLTLTLPRNCYGGTGFDEIVIPMSKID